MRTLLIILGIWLLLNVLFVVVMSPPRKPRRPEPAGQSGSVAPQPIDKNAYPYDDEEKVSLRHIIVSVGMGAFFVLSPFLLEAIEATKRFFKRGRE